MIVDLLSIGPLPASPRKSDHDASMDRFGRS
jgi:hypothetical protein